MFFFVFLFVFHFLFLILKVFVLFLRQTTLKHEVSFSLSCAFFLLSFRLVLISPFLIWVVLFSHLSRFGWFCLSSPLRGDVSPLPSFWICCWEVLIALHLSLVWCAAPPPTLPPSLSSSFLFPFPSTFPSPHHHPLCFSMGGAVCSLRSLEVALTFLLLSAGGADLPFFLK